MGIKNIIKMSKYSSDEIKEVNLINGGSFNKKHLEECLLAEYDLLNFPKLPQDNNEVTFEYRYNVNYKNYLKSIGLSKRVELYESDSFRRGVIIPIVCKTNMIVFIKNLHAMKMKKYYGRLAKHNIKDEKIKEIINEASKLYEKVNIEIQKEFADGKLTDILVVELEGIINIADEIEEDAKK